MFLLFSGKYRNFTFLVYPEGLSDDFVSVLASTGGKGFYILHDMDFLSDGTQKKEHYHFFIMFDNPRSLNSVKKIGLRCGAANGHVEPVSNTVSMARYLCHMDNPDKHRYDPDEITSFGGADYLELCETKTDRKTKRREIVCQMIKYICDNKIYSYSELFEFCCSYRQDWLDYLLIPSVGRAVLEYIKSKNWTDNR